MKLIVLLVVLVLQFRWLLLQWILHGLVSAPHRLFCFLKESGLTDINLNLQYVLV